MGTIRADVTLRTKGWSDTPWLHERKSENGKMKKKEGIGTYDRSEVVNGTEVYYGGMPDRKRVSNDAPRAWVFCASCAACKRREEAGEDEPAHQCLAIVTDEGRAMNIEAPRMTRCERWMPKPYLARIGKTRGKVDPPAFIRWKAENPSIIGWPKDHGKKKMETTREFLWRMYRNSTKIDPY